MSRHRRTPISRGWSEAGYGGIGAATRDTRHGAGAFVLGPVTWMRCGLGPGGGLPLPGGSWCSGGVGVVVDGLREELLDVAGLVPPVGDGAHDPGVPRGGVAPGVDPGACLP